MKKRCDDFLSEEGVVTIIVAVYNCENYLERCLNSIILQTYKELEIILIDDGSTDGSGKICDEYAERDKRLKVIHQKNRGLSGARNRGLLEMKGEYAMFVDADDYIETDMVEYLMGGEADIVICSHFVEFENGKKRDFNTGGFKKRKMESAEAIRTMLNEDGFMVSAWGKLFRKEVFSGIKFPEGKLHEDVGATYKAFLKAREIVFLPLAKYHYMQREGSISKGGFRVGRMDLIELTDKMCDEIDEKYPELGPTTKRRRMRARLAILRQTDERQKENSEVLAYLKKNQNDILKNSEARKGEIMALKLALLNQGILKASYKAGKKLKII